MLARTEFILPDIDAQSQKEKRAQYLQELKRDRPLPTEIQNVYGMISKLRAERFSDEKPEEITSTALINNIPEKGKKRWSWNTLTRVAAVGMIASSVLLGTANFLKEKFFSTDAHVASITQSQADLSIQRAQKTQLLQTPISNLPVVEIHFEQPEITHKETPKVEEQPNIRIHQVQKGDNLFAIMRENGLKNNLFTLREIILANPQYFKHPGEHTTGNYFTFEQANQLMSIGKTLQVGWNLELPLHLLETTTD